MKSQKNLITVSGNVDRTGARKMGVNQKNLGALLSILSNMYEDSYEAVLREYTANGFDSHVAAGQTRPVEVTLPNEWQPSLMIRDYGLGMTKDTMENVYAEYLTSTKEETDEQVGGFGIGAKSAFTLGQQFIVTGIKDGQKTVVMFSLDEDNVGETNVMFEGPTDEPQGVLVSLAVEDVERMQETAVRVFRTWAPGTVLVDGVAPHSVFENATMVNESTAFVPEASGTVYATLGPVAYPINRKILQQVSKTLETAGHASASVIASTLASWSNQTTTDVYFRANVGEMTVAPNREGLRDTKRTIDALASYVLGLAQDTVDSVQTKVDAARTDFEAVRIFREQQEAIAPIKISRKDVTFGGRPLKRKTAYVALTNYVMGTKNYRSNTPVVLEHSSVEFEIEEAAKAIVVTGVKVTEFGKVRRFAKRFLENTDYKRIIVTDADAASYNWFTFGVEGGAPTMTLEDYRTVLRGFRADTVRMINEPSYTVGIGATASRDLDDRDLLTDIIAEGRDILVVEQACPGGALAEAALGDYTVVVLLATQSETALRKRIAEDGTVQVLDLDVYTLIREEAERVFATVTADERAAMGASAWLSGNAYAARTNSYAEYARVFGDEHFPQVQEIQDAADLARLVAQDIDDNRRSLLNLVTRTLGKSIDIPTFDYEIPELSQTHPMLAEVSLYGIDPERKSWFKENLYNDVKAYLDARKP